MQKRILFLDGNMVLASQALLKSLSPGLLKGVGVFETMRAYEGKIFALPEHLERFFTGLKELKINHHFSQEKIKEHLYSALCSNNLKDARLRLTIWQVRQKLKVSIIVFPLGSLASLKYEKGFRATISDVRQDETVRLPSVKSIDYLLFLKAFQRAKHRGYDESILLNKKGFLAEGSRSNIFLIKNKVLLTPSLSSGCLNGITRKIVLRIAKEKKIARKETSLLPEDLFEADEAFLTNSLIEVMPLTRVSGKIIGSGKIGKITAQILQSYRRIVREQYSGHLVF